jgi:hypothetical protein
VSKIVISIEYAGLQLQIAKNANGQDVTPLKPISDLFGLKWETQRIKVGDGEFLNRFLGVCTPLMGGADSQKREQTCILLARVAAFLMSINPDRVRTNGNIAGADFLEQKINEWADALHDYEELGVAINMNHAKAQEALRKQRASFAQMIGIKNKTADLPDRNALGHVVKQMAGELGIPYQMDLAD